MYFLSIFLFFVYRIHVCYGAVNCTDCGYGYCLEIDVNTTMCTQCACPANFSGDCCEIEPEDGCLSEPCQTGNSNEHFLCVNYTGGQYECVCENGYYGQNCSEPQCSLSDGTALYVDESAEAFINVTKKSYNPTSTIPMENGTLLCLQTTNNSDVMSGRTDPGDGINYEIELNCPNACIYGSNGYWKPNNQIYTRFLFRPVCVEDTCGVYVYQSWVLSNGATQTPSDSSLGLVRTSDSALRSALEQRPNGTAPPVPFGESEEYDYIIATGVSCGGCPFDTTESDIPTEPPSPICDMECYNGGMCVLSDNGNNGTNETCQCLNIWTGANCSTFDPCAYFSTNSNYSCLNNGTCFSNDTYFPSYRCRCPKGFCGSRCQATYCPTTTSTTLTRKPTTLPTTPNPVVQTVSTAITQPDFSQQYLPYLLANMSTEEKMNASWVVTDLYTWAAYENTELDLNTDLVKWYEPSMGNCFTFNQENASKIYYLRYSGEQGGFRARMQINQAEYYDWVYTASLLVFLHRRQETIMGESVSYQIAPGEETTFVVQRNVYTRLGHPYGVCISSPSQVKSYYNPGSAYTIDSCIRSCYQDYVQEICGCMDPKYYMAYNAQGCDITKMDCVDNITNTRGDPSTWPDCYCPPPCLEYLYDVSWTKAVFKTLPTECTYENSSDIWDTNPDCMDEYTSNIAIFSVQFPRLFHKNFVETPKYNLSYILASLFNITGLILGLSAVTVFELIFLAIRLFHVICMNQSAVHDQRELMLSKKEKINIFNIPTVTEFTEH